MIFCYQTDELAACAILLEFASEGGCGSDGMLLLNTTHLHTKMIRFNNYCNTKGRSVSWMQSRICVVSRSCTCKRRA